MLCYNSFLFFFCWCRPSDLVLKLLVCRIDALMFTGHLRMLLNQFIILSWRWSHGSFHLVFFFFLFQIVLFIIIIILKYCSNKFEACFWNITTVHVEQVQEDMRKGQVALEKYIITKTLTKPPEAYPDAKNQPHVQVSSRSTFHVQY